MINAIRGDKIWYDCPLSVEYCAEIAVAQVCSTLPHKAAPYFPYCNTTQGQQLLVSVILEYGHNDSRVACEYLKLCNATESLEDGVY